MKRSKKTETMTEESTENSAEMTDKDLEQEEYISSYRMSGLFSVNPRYQATVIDVGSGALTANMLEAVSVAMEKSFGAVDWHPTVIVSAAHMRYFEKMEEERKQRELFDNSPVGRMLK